MGVMADNLFMQMAVSESAMIQAEGTRYDGGSVQFTPNARGSIDMNI